jgi:hypothetical protein
VERCHADTSLRRIPMVTGRTSSYVEGRTECYRGRTDRAGMLQLCRRVERGTLGKDRGPRAPGLVAVAVAVAVSSGGGADLRVCLLTANTLTSFQA